MGYADRYLIAHRYKRLFSDAKIVLVIREQVAFLNSLFNQWQKHPYIFKHSFARWVRWQIEISGKGYAGSSLKIPQYWDIYTLYADLFGACNVKVMLYEDLKTAPGDFVTTFMKEVGSQKTQHTLSKHENFAGSTSKNRINQLFWCHSFLRRVPLLHRGLSFLSDFTQRRDFLPSNLTEVVNDIYRAGNKKLMDEAKVDLKKYNYPL